ncbi:MAG: hypothetical protein KatS3mg008_0534 [Acidimicrobiales bacterium]|nr:MAG: hypothetical protein KatS3mg008_0534 [Acidimicrobiales bacterium]
MSMPGETSVQKRERARRIVLHAAAFVAAFALLNLGAAAVGSAMNPPLFWYHRIAEGHVEVMRDITSTHGCVDMAVVGNSVALVGIRPLQLTRRLRVADEVYNASLLNSGAQIDVEWMRAAVLPALQPAVLVLVPLSTHFSATSPVAKSLKRTWTSAAATRSDGFAGLNRWALETFPLFRFASRLSDFREWGGLVIGKAPNEDQLSMAVRQLYGLGKGGHSSPEGKTAEGVQRPDQYEAGFARREWGWPGFADQRFKTGGGDELATDRALRRELTSWSIDPTQVEIYEDFVTKEEKRGVEVILVLPPVSDAFVAMHPQGWQSLERFRKIIGSIAAASGADLLDLSELVDLSTYDFSDPVHLTARGTQKFGDELARRLAAIEKPSWSCESRG